MTCPKLIRNGTAVLEQLHLRRKGECVSGLVTHASRRLVSFVDGEHEGMEDADGG